MAITAPQIVYTTREFEEIRQELINFAQAQFPGDSAWNDFLESNSGVVILEMFAFVGDILNFYQDRQANEAFIDRVQTIKNMISLCKLIGYRLKTSTAATAVETLTFPASPNTIVIPVGLQFQSPSSGQIYQVVDDTLNGRPAPQNLTPGTTSTTVTIKNIQTRTETFVSPGIPKLALKLQSTPFIDEAVVNEDFTVTALTKVYVDSTLWQQVDNFLDSTITSQQYIVSVDENGFASVIFGDGNNGAIPIESSNIVVSYFTGGGSIGNANDDTITSIVTFIQDLAGNIIDAVATNTDAATGGTDQEDIEHARFAAPASLKVKFRTVAREDFIINSELVPGVARAQVLTVNEFPSMQQNTAWVYIAPTITDSTPIGTTAPTSLLDAVKTQLTVTYPTTITLNVDVFSAVYVPVDVAATVYLESSVNWYDMNVAITEALANYFDFTQVNTDGDFVIQFGQTTYKSKLIAVIQDVLGVIHLTLTAPAADVATSPWKLPILGTVTLSFVGGSSSSTTSSTTSSTSSTTSSSTSL